MTSNRDNERRAQIRLEILKRLNSVSGKMLNQNVLYADTNVHLSRRAELSEFLDELEELTEMFLVVIVADRLGGPRRIYITDAGRAELAAQRG